MKLVIDIPESICDTIQADQMISREQLAVLQMHILNGTPLPAGHGRLIEQPTDADIAETIGGQNDFADCIRETVATVFANAKTIVEADGGAE